jgi:hypothetical protein
MTFRDDLRALFTLRESPVRWPVALQAAIAMGLPYFGFALAGRADLGLLASTGSFTTLFLAGRSRRQRARLLPFIALGLIASSALGVAASGSVALALTSVFVVVVASTTLVLGLGIGPPGALFFVLVAGVATHLAGPVSLGGAGLDGRLVIGLLAVGAVVAYLVVLAPLVLPAVRRSDAVAFARRAPLRFQLIPTDRVILGRVIGGAAIAALIAAPVGVHRAYWVILTVVVILQNGHTIRLSVHRAAHRVLGTLVGVGVFALLMLLHPDGLLLGFLLVLLQFGVELVVIRNYGLALVLITPLALLISAQGVGATVSATVFDRVVDTLLGAAIALGVLGVAYLLQRRRALPV